MVRTPEVPSITDACEICKKKRHRFLFQKDGYDFWKCLHCRYVFVPFRQSDETLQRLYDEAFFQSAAYADYAADRAVLEKNFARFISVIQPYCPPGRMLEIGCAYGFFLNLAKEIWDVEGIDISQEGIAHAQEIFGVKVTQGDFLKVPYEDNAYDSVTMWDTIEHLRHPADYIAKVSRILRPGGTLALTTGDVGSVVARIRGSAWRLYYPPFHLHYFSKRTLAMLLEQHGLKLAYVTTAGYHRSLDMILHRVFVERKQSASQAVYRLAKRVGLANRRALYLNLFDIMLAVAVKQR